MKKRLLDFRERLSNKGKNIMAIITFIIGLIVNMVVMDIWIATIGMTESFLLVMLLLAITVVTGLVIYFWVEDIRTKEFEKTETEACERLKSILTNEFKTFSLKIEGDYDYFTRILVEEVPYVFKARMENDIIYYQFEMKDGEIFSTGEFTGYYSSFEEWIKS